MPRIGFTSSGVVRFVRSGAGPGLIGAGLPLSDGRLTQSHGGLIPREAEALGPYRSAPEFDHWPWTTHAAGV